MVDFGEAFDFIQEGLVDMLLPYPHSGVGRGGCPNYLPPEIKWAVCGHGKELDYGKADQFGVGLILWSMLAADTSTLPFSEHGQGYIPLAAGLYHPEAEQLIMALTQRDPVQRLRVTDDPPRWIAAHQRLDFQT